MPRGNKPRAGERAFTAIEMLAVLALAAVTAAAASLSLLGSKRSSDLASVVDRWAYFDQLTRRLARRAGQPFVLAVDTDGGTVTRKDPSADGASEPRDSVFRLPEGCRIDRVTTAALPGASGAVSLPFSPNSALLLTCLRRAADDRRPSAVGAGVERGATSAWGGRRQRRRRDVRPTGGEKMTTKQYATSFNVFKRILMRSGGTTLIEVVAGLRCWRRRWRRCWWSSPASSANRARTDRRLAP